MFINDFKSTVIEHTLTHFSQETPKMVNGNSAGPDQMPLNAYTVCINYKNFYKTFTKNNG